MMQVPMVSLVKCMMSIWIDEALMDVGMRADGRRKMMGCCDG
jgi:hypothetical protein